ncbi:MAG: energy transducer TonB [Acidobacteriota bacterium]
MQRGSLAANGGSRACKSAVRPEAEGGDPRETEATIELECGNPTPFGLAGAIAGGTVTPPVTLSKQEPTYSEKARNSKTQGEVQMRLLIDITGHVSDIAVIKSLGMGLDEKAVEAAKRWRFKPGMRDGLPVISVGTIAVTFRLL